MTGSSATPEVQRHGRKGKTNSGGPSLVTQGAMPEGKSVLGYKEGGLMQLQKQQKELLVLKCSEQF